jgi:hypothetical protein
MAAARCHGSVFAAAPALQQPFHGEAVVHPLTAPAGLGGLVGDLEACTAVRFDERLPSGGGLVL